MVSGTSPEVDRAVPPRPPAGRRAHWPMLLLSLAISAVFVYLAVHNADLGKSWRTLTHIDWRFLVLPAALFMIHMPLRGWRWHLLYEPHHRPGFAAAFQTLAIGTGVNNFLPARAGDVARCVLIGRRTHEGSSTRALATMGVEKVLDGLILVAVIVFSLLFMTPPHWVWRLTIVSALVFGAGFFVLFMLRYHREWLLARIEHFFVRIRLAQQGAKAHAILTAFAEGLGSMTSPAQMVRMILLTATIWVLEGLMIWSLTRSFHVPLSPMSGLFFSAVVGLASVVPAAPANVGSYEFFGAAALRLAGLARGNALALVLVLHAWTFLSTSILGLCCFGAAGLHFRQLRGQDLDSIADENCGLKTGTAPGSPREEELNMEN